jgi:hypothetical protein
MGGVNTIVKVRGPNFTLNQHAGIAYWILKPTWLALFPELMGIPHAMVGSVANPGYIANVNEDVAFPAPALGPQALGATIGYTLTGQGFFPSAAVSKVKPDRFWQPANIQVVKRGQAPNDDFCEYGFCATGPVWGYYSGAVADLSNRYLATGLIQFPACSDVQFFFDPSCGGTRGAFTNWGTALIKTND